MVTETKIEELCLKGESETLDFKREQYKFHGDKNQKSELLKDILAFANAWRESNAYILIGIAEKNGQGEIVGISSSDIIDDADIQQFINTKTNKKIPFTCFTVNCKKGIIQLIEIRDCINERPFYSVKDFGNVRKDIVKIRRGTSINDASPDEIAKMVEARIAKQQPILEAQISPTGCDKYSLNQITLRTFNVDFESEPEQETFTNRSGLRPHVFDPFYVSPQKRQIWIKECFGICSIDLQLKSLSDVQAKDIKIRTQISNASTKIEQLDCYPAKSFDVANISPIRNFIGRITNIHPQDTYHEEKLIYLRPETSGVADLIITVYGENIKTPLLFNFKLDFIVEGRTLSVKCLDDQYWGYFDEDRIFDMLNEE